MAVLGRLHLWCAGFLYFLLSSRNDALSMHEFLEGSPGSIQRLVSIRKRLSDDEIDWDKVTTEAFSLVDDTYFTNTDPLYYNYTGYNSYQPIRSELYRLQDQFPDFVTVEMYGETHEGREQLALHINKHNSEDVVFINSLIHAREWIAGCITMHFIHMLLSDKPEKNIQEALDIDLLLKSFHFIIIPVVNPDGYEYTFTKNRLWRKNREPAGGENCKGTDVNRNFMYGYKPYSEAEEDSASKRGPCSESYPGTGVLSTKEAAALQSLLIKYKHYIRYYVDYHMYGNDWVYPYGANKRSPQNKQQLDRYGAAATEVLNKVTNDTWDFGGVSDVIYKCHGILVDHVYFYFTPIAYTVEVGNEETDFRAPDTTIPHYTSSQWAALLSNLKLLHIELESKEYQIEKTRNWRRTSMVRRETE